MQISRNKPLIFLDFANDRSDGLRYLRNLPQEARLLQDALRPAEQAGLCEVVLRQNVTLDQVLDVFQDARYRHRIALFHYAGVATVIATAQAIDDAVAAGLADRFYRRLAGGAGIETAFNEAESAACVTSLSRMWQPRHRGR